MAGYLQKTYEAGPMKIVTKYFSSRYGSRGGSREDWSRPTPEKVAELNERRSEFKLWLLLLQNFRPGDLHLVLTYRRENRPKEISLLKKDMQVFLRKCRALYRKQGKVFKYIWVCEYESTAPHFHLIAPQIDPKFLAELWPHGNIRPSYLYAEGNFKPLAHYLIKETRRTFRDKLVSGRRWNPSKNLEKYREETREVGHRSWTKAPKAPRGYLLLGEAQEGVHELFGTPYQYYELLRLTPAKGGRKRE